MAIDRGVGLAHQDTPYSWLVLVACLGLQLLYASGVGTIGVLIVHLSETFNVNKSALTWVGGLLLFVGFVVGFIPSMLARKYGCRVVGFVASIFACVSFFISAFAQTVNILYFSHGILASISLGTFFNMAIISSQQYFHRYRSLAAGVTMASVSAGILIWPPACQLLIDHYGWRGAFMVIGGIQLHGMVFSALIRPVPQYAQPVLKEMKEMHTHGESCQNEHIESDQQDSPLCKTDGKNHAISIQSEPPPPPPPQKQGICCASFCDTVKNVMQGSCQPVTNTPQYVVYLLSIFLIQTGHVTALSMLPLLGHNLGINKTLSASLLSILGGVGGISRTLSGLLGDWRRVNRSVVVSMSGLTSGLITCGMAYLYSYAGLATVVVALGLTSGAYNALQSACVIDYVGRQQMAPGVGLLSLAMGFGRLSALLLSGAVLEVVGDPKLVFVVFGLVEAAGGIILICLVLIRRCKSAKHSLPSQPDQPT